MEQKSITKNVVIFDHDGGRLGNQLWNLVSVFAYCSERGYSCINYSFYEYYKYFELSKTNFFFDVIFLRLHPFLRYKFYKYYTRYIYQKYPHNILDIRHDPKNKVVETFHLPPSPIKHNVHLEKLTKTEQLNDTIYFSGWLFRNPIGIEKFHDEIKRFLSPKREFLKNAGDLITKMRTKGQKVVGVHIRGGDYVIFEQGKFYFTQREARKILDEYLAKESSGNVVFVICSDEKIDDEVFEGLTYSTGTGHIIEDLLSLSMTDLVIGSDSTYGTFAAYYGNIPIVFFKKSNIDWTPVLLSQFNHSNGSLTVHP